MPRGGSRPGSGRKPKDETTAGLHGSRRRSVVRFPSPLSAEPETITAPAEPVDAPADLSAAGKVVWAKLAPHAREKGTLWPETVEAFALFCRAVVLERKLSKGRSAGSSNHRGMMQRVEAGMLRFGIAPNGKPIVKKAAIVDPFAEFDQPATGRA
jgi:hypothetical protein